MAEHVERRDLGINSEFLRQIAEDLADFVLLLEDVEAVERDGAGIGILESRDRTHQRALAGAIRTQQPKHIVADAQRYIFERLHTIWVRLGKTGDCQCHYHLLDRAEFTL